MQRIFNAGLFLFHFGFGCSADIDDCNAADDFRQPLLQFLAVIIGGGLLDLGADLLDAGFDGLFGAIAFDDRGVVLVDGDALGAAQVFHGDGLKLDAEVFGDHLAAGQDRDILKHCLAAVAEAGSLHGSNLQGAAQLVDHQCCQRFAFHIFGNDQEGLAGAGNLLENRAADPSCC